MFFFLDFLVTIIMVFALWPLTTSANIANDGEFDYGGGGRGEGFDATRSGQLRWLGG